MTTTLTKTKKNTQVFTNTSKMNRTSEFTMKNNSLHSTKKQNYSENKTLKSYNDALLFFNLP